MQRPGGNLDTKEQKFDVTINFKSKVGKHVLTRACPSNNGKSYKNNYLERYRS
jgi:hypothetical protein